MVSAMTFIRKMLTRARVALLRNRGSLQGIVGVVAISVGVGMIYPPAALIVGGALVLLDKVL